MNILPGKSELLNELNWITNALAKPGKNPIIQMRHKNGRKSAWCPERPQFYTSYPVTSEAENYVTYHDKIQ